MHVITTLQEGILDDPRLFTDEEKAGKFYEALLTSKDVLVRDPGFRKRNEGETWTEYITAFHEWEDTDECPYDKMDFEIHWHNEVEVDCQFLIVIN